MHKVINYIILGYSSVLLIYLVWGLGIPSFMLLVHCVWGTRHPELDVVRWLCMGQHPGTAKKSCVTSCSYLLSSGDIISGFYVKSFNRISYQVVPRSDVDMTQSLTLSSLLSSHISIAGPQDLSWLSPQSACHPSRSPFLITET